MLKIITSQNGIKYLYYKKVVNMKWQGYKR